MKVQKVSTGYIPRSWQQRTHNKLKRHNILVFHRRGGKTVFGLNEMIDKAVRFSKRDPKTGLLFKNPQFAFVATTVGQAEKIAWPYLKEYCKGIPGVKFNESKLRVTFPHPHGICTIFVFGAENFDNMRGIYLDGYILDEFADMHPDVRDKVLLPTLSDRKGWEIIIGTPKGDNAFKTLYMQALEEPDLWFSCLHKASETGILDDDELKMLQRTMSEEAYRQEYECDFDAAPKGFYYATQMQHAKEEGRIGEFPYDPNRMVGTFWDIGVSDSTVIWFVQEVDRQPYVIDYYENHGMGYEHYHSIIEKKGYKYAAHFFPHDVKQVEPLYGGSRLDFLQTFPEFRDKIRVVPKSTSLAEDIHKVRQFLTTCKFNREGTAEGRKSLCGYMRKYDPKEQCYAKTPLHNWASHGADGFRQLAVSFEHGILEGIDPYYDLPDEADGDYDVFTV